MSDTRSFLGMRIVGDRSSANERKAQRSAAELAPYFQEVFADGIVDAVRWDQYTPYFNDGDPCVFSANAYSLMVRVAGHAPTADEAIDMESGADVGTAEDFREGWIETESYYDADPIRRLIGHLQYDTPKWNGGVPTVTGPHPELVAAIEELKGALGGGEFNNALQDLFGDHAKITVPASGDIEVETYEHD